jgi:hypothetical protein
VTGVTATITHDVNNTIFTFTSSNPLAVSIAYTAKITTRARNCREHRHPYDRGSGHLWQCPGN